MSSVAEIAQAARELFLEEQRALVGRLTQQVQAEVTGIPIKERTFGLRRGMVWISPDLDDPLPDDFWLGEAAATFSAGGSSPRRSSKAFMG